MTQLPQYRCHKVVRAAQIQRVHFDRLVLGLIVDGCVIERQVTAEWLNKHEPMFGGYFVEYEDGHTSFSPKDAFEAGYTQVEEPKQFVATNPAGEPANATFDRLMSDVATKGFAWLMNGKRIDPASIFKPATDEQTDDLAGVPSEQPAGDGAKVFDAAAEIKALAERVEELEKVRAASFRSLSRDIGALNHRLASLETARPQRCRAAGLPDEIKALREDLNKLVDEVIGMAGTQRDISARLAVLATPRFIFNPGVVGPSDLRPTCVASDQLARSLSSGNVAAGVDLGAPGGDWSALAFRVSPAGSDAEAEALQRAQALPAKTLGQIKLPARLLHTHETRVLSEKAALDDRIERLDKFVGSDAFGRLAEEDCDLLADQLYVMRCYARILARRIELFPKD